MENQNQNQSNITEPTVHETFWHRHLLAELLSIFLVAATMGVIYWAYAGVPPDTKWEPVKHSESKVADTSTWKTYTDDQYGFSFKYPETWQVEQSDSFIMANSAETIKERNKPESLERAADFFILVDKNPKHLSIEKYYNGENGPALFDSGITNKQITIGDKTAYSFMNVPGEGGPVSPTIIPLGDIFLDIGGSSAVGDQILSTFKFINSVSFPVGTSCKYAMKQINDPSLGIVVADMVVMTTKEGTSDEKVASFVSEVDGTVICKIPELNIYEVQLPPAKDASNIKDAIKKLELHSEVKSAEPSTFFEPQK